MYVMMADNHIYTLNHDIKKLEQMHDEEHANAYQPTVNENYYIKDEVEDRPHKMISDIEDFRRVIQELGPAEIDDKGKPKKRIVKFIHKEENLNKLLDDFISSLNSPPI